jgi:aspartyl-tRNA(Asn)/glutamyl-tRNA(Gln) amidotransferase subunit A
LRFRIPRGYFFALLDRQVASAFERACDRLRDDGASVEDVEVPHAGDVSAIYLHIVLAEAAAYHAKTLEGRPDDYTPNVRMRLEMGRYVLAEDYARAMRGRDLIRREVDAALDGCDGLLLPSLAIPAPKIGEATIRLGSVDEPVRNLMLRCTQTFNVSGHPAITIPCGRTVEQLPIGVQIVGRFGATSRLLDVAQVVEATIG